MLTELGIHVGLKSCILSLDLNLVRATVVFILLKIGIRLQKKSGAEICLEIHPAANKAMSVLYVLCHNLGGANL